MNWWDENKKLNEQDYKENYNGDCQHRDKIISDEIKCRSCGYSKKYIPGSNYEFS